MPKDYFADNDPLDSRKQQAVSIKVEEDVLNKLLSIVDRDEAKNTTLKQFLAPFDDCLVTQEQVSVLDKEVSNFIQRNGHELGSSQVTFLYLITGLCSAAIRTGLSVFGIAD